MGCSSKKIPKLSRRQKDVYEFILMYVRLKGCQPSFREIKDNFGWKSFNAVTPHIRGLIRKGFCIMDGPKYSRNLIFIKDTVGNPFKGFVLI